MLTTASQSRYQNICFITAEIFQSMEANICYFLVSRQKVHSKILICIIIIILLYVLILNCRGSNARINNVNT